jgi:hypothetical protein
MRVVVGRPNAPTFRIASAPRCVREQVATHIQ